MKRKNWIIVAGLLVAAAGAGTSHAYLTAQDQVDNVFNASAVDITVEEDFEPEPPEPGKRIKKAPRVHSESDVECYVRIRYAFTDSDAEKLCEPVRINPGWTLKDDGYYYWEKTVSPGKETGALFDCIEVKKEIAEEDIIPFDILVYAEAVQAGELSETEAWAGVD